MGKTEVKKNNERRLMPRNPFTNFREMEKEMEQMFGDWWWRYPERFGFAWPRRRWMMEASEFLKPVIDIYEEKDALVVKAEIPGIKKDEIEINLSENCLTIKGEKKREEKKDEEGYHWSERAFGTFERTIELPREIVAEKISASFKEGVLEIRMPKKEENQKKELNIKVN